jgi:hypothetical protein
VRIIDIARTLWSLARNVEDLLGFQGQLRVGLDEVNSRLRNLEDRMTHLEANQRQIIVEAQAAGAASTAVSGAVISDVVTRLTRMEMRAEEDAKHLLPR